MRIIVAGATGTVGRRLVPALLERGHSVRCLTRDLVGPRGETWSGDVEVHRGDLDRPQSLVGAFDAIDAAYYLVHALDSGTDGLVDREVAQAETFRDAAADARLRRIVYLGGLVDADRIHDASDHMYARRQVGITLADGDVPVTEVRAGIVLAADSASFLMLQASESVPVRVRSTWGRSRVQPIAIADIVHVLAEIVGVEDAADRVLEVGGPDVVTYDDLVDRYLRLRSAPPRFGFPVPFAPAEAAAPLAAVLSGVDQRVVLALLQSARHDAIVRENDALELLDHQPMDLDTALRRAIAGA